VFEVTLTDNFQYHSRLVVTENITGKIKGRLVVTDNITGKIKGRLVVTDNITVRSKGKCPNYRYMEAIVISSSTKFDNSFHFFR
jgi:hypothetical protein